jgi:hypothetical protein
MIRNDYAGIREMIIGEAPDFDLNLSKIENP